MFCGECGNGVELSSGDCPSCGADLLDSVSYQKQGFVVSRPNTKTIVLVCCVIAMLTAGGLYYTSVDQLELQSQGSVQVLASEYHILHLTDVEEVRWNVTYYDSVWPKSLSSQYLTSDSLDAALEYSNGFT